MDFLIRYPFPVTGLILALFVIGDTVRAYGEWIRALVGCLAFVMYALYVMKLLLFRGNLKDEMNDLTAARLPTFAMATMFLSGYASSFSPTLGAGLWYVGVVGHVLLMVWFSYRFVLRGFSFKNMYPSWFTVYVGIAAASITAPVAGRTDVGQVAFWFALAAFAVLLPLVCWRAWWIRRIPDAAKTTMVIFTMPCALLAAGYITSFETEMRDPRIINVLTLLSSILYLIGLGYYIFYMWKQPDFKPTHADFAFPIALSALSTRLSTNAARIVLETTSLLAGMETIFASLIVLDVLVHYLMMLFVILKKAWRHSSR